MAFPRVIEECRYLVLALAEIIVWVYKLWSVVCYTDRLGFVNSPKLFQRFYVTRRRVGGHRRRTPLETKPTRPPMPTRGVPGFHGDLQRTWGVEQLIKHFHGTEQKAA